MTEDNVSELPQIEFTREQSDIGHHSRIYINVKGATLDECRKHFDEILKGAENGESSHN